MNPESKKSEEDCHVANTPRNDDSKSMDAESTRNGVVSIRDKALESVRNFKQSWVAVAQVLTDIAYGGDYKEWGFDDFEAYCSNELGLKQRQVKKMMRSFFFLKKERPKQLEAIIKGEDVACPGYEIINDIEAAKSTAKTTGNYDSNALKEVEAKLFDGKISGREASQEIKEAHIAPGDITPPDPTVKQLRKIATQYRRLCSEAEQNERIPDTVAEKMKEVLAQLLAVTGE